MILSDFEKKLFERLMQVPRGKVTTYGDLARVLGRPKAARAVGNILNKNPDAPRVPCHRVVKSNGEIGGYAMGAEKKKELLSGEGILIINGSIRDFKSRLYLFR